ncbi:MAG TPA: hypothetical protein VK324_03410, partial [Tepidisphaeraceae bacterium]|nr:hypothetical protein [Tepidisphaeraceae bacterium]
MVEQLKSQKNLGRRDGRWNAGIGLTAAPEGRSYGATLGFNVGFGKGKPTYGVSVGGWGTAA